ncbi:hypothetical protein LJC14_07440 [Treponema sp. OttesenSCG-928-L16]|nr:hypothetical protein [Treponema sp. OttesenSCG-928-L16]
MPLYGKWADNRGDTLSFFDDGSFLAVINDPYTGNKRHMEGSFNVLANALSFSCNDGTQIVSEWDIRGNMLYLIWSNSYGDLIPLTLYKISN